MEIKDIVINKLTAKNMCGYGVEQAQNADSAQDLINLMLSPKGIEFCMQKGFPQTKDLIEHKDILQDNNIIIEGEQTLINPRLVLVYGGEVTIHIDGYNVCEVYATNDAKVRVIAKENAYVSIEEYKDSIVNIERYDMAKIYKKGE